jgi:hypothetical protein
MGHSLGAYVSSYLYAYICFMIEVELDLARSGNSDCTLLAWWATERRWELRHVYGNSTDKFTQSPRLLHMLRPRHQLQSLPRPNSRSAPQPSEERGEDVSHSRLVILVVDGYE